jgi:hypothetical protein
MLVQERARFEAEKAREEGRLREAQKEVEMERKRLEEMKREMQEE